MSLSLNTKLTIIGGVASGLMFYYEHFVERLNPQMTHTGQVVITNQNDQVQILKQLQTEIRHNAEMIRASNRTHHSNDNLLSENAPYYDRRITTEEGYESRGELSGTYEVFDTYKDPRGETFLALNSLPYSMRSVDAPLTQRLAELEDGTELTVLSTGYGSSKSWYKVRVLTGEYEGLNGYVHSNWVRKKRSGSQGDHTDYGKIKLSSVPQAEVYIDRYRLGWTPLVGRELPIGKLNIELRYQDGKRHVHRTYLSRGETKLVRCKKRESTVTCK